MRRLSLFIVFCIGLTGALVAQDIRVPRADGSVKFAVIGDSGTGDRKQAAVASQLAAAHTKFPFEFVIMLGDNLYGREGPDDYADKFERPYRTLLDREVKFYAALGNHDDPEQRLYKLFNMNGERYYSFKPGVNTNVRFFALDSNYMDPRQVEWLEEELSSSGSDWKIAFFHHPLYASGRHGSNEVLRAQIEPIFVKHRVNVVFTGHEHFYERVKPQKGIQYFVSGASAKLRKGDIDPTGLTAFGYDQGYTFMLAEIIGDRMHYQVIDERGRNIDAGIVVKGEEDEVVGTVGTTTAKPAPKPAPKPAAKPAPAPAPKPQR